MRLKPSKEGWEYLERIGTFGSLTGPQNNPPQPWKGKEPKSQADPAQREEMQVESEPCSSTEDELNDWWESEDAWDTEEEQRKSRRNRYLVAGITIALLAVLIVCFM